jgi:hypothetical protein
MLAYITIPPTRRTPIQHFGRRSRLSPKVQRNNFLLLSSPLTTAIGPTRKPLRRHRISGVGGEADPSGAPGGGLILTRNRRGPRRALPYGRRPRIGPRSNSSSMRPLAN